MQTAAPAVWQRCHTLHKGGKGLKWGCNVEPPSQDATFPLILFATVEGFRGFHLGVVCVCAVD